MPDSSSQPTQNPTYPADYADCGARINEANIASYMWYIHVTVRVNAADRLRHSLAHILGRATTTTAPLSPSYSAPFGFGHINTPSSSRNDGTRTLVHGDDFAGAADRIDDLYDYMVLQHFSWSMLETLINTAPVEELARGYASALAGIPAHFREEFCRRLYCLLFSKYIVEWPQGIAVPEPAPGSIAAAAAAAAASAATSPGSEAGMSSTSSNTDATERRNSPIQTPQEEDHDVDGGYKSCMNRIASSTGVTLSDDEEDYFTYNNSILDSSEKYKKPAIPEPKSPGYQSTLGPATPGADTPSPGYNPELARAAYFGTVSEPQPIQYRGNWGRMSSSSRDDGTARGACAEAKTSVEGIGEHAFSAAAVGEGISNDDQRLPSATVISPPRCQQGQHQHHLQAPPHDATPQSRPASLLGSAHSRLDVSHTGSCCCSCRAREAWSHGVGVQR